MSIANLANLILKLMQWLLPFEYSPYPHYSIFPRQLIVKSFKNKYLSKLRHSCMLQRLEPYSQPMQLNGWWNNQHDYSPRVVQDVFEKNANIFASTSMFRKFSNHHVPSNPVPFLDLVKNQSRIIDSATLCIHVHQHGAHKHIWLKSRLTGMAINLLDPL